MSSQVYDAPVRRHLRGRQADTVARLTEAAVAELRAAGYEGLTVRNVARRAGVAAATVYAYFASKDHLVAEVFWRRLQDVAPVRTDRRRSVPARLDAALRDVALLVADEPELAAACLPALLAGDPDVARLRRQIGDAILERIRHAVEDDVDPAVVRALWLAFNGALLQAGMGYLSYDELPDRMVEVAALLLGGRRRRD
ncbi:MAG: TetR/AcrR family transcriptional regulator [Acidimicrobiales bacterium]